MARVLLILSIVFVLAAAGLGFMAKQKVDLLQDDLSSAKSTLASTQSSLKASEKKLSDTEADLNQTRQSLEQSKTEETKAKADLTDAQTKLAATQAEMTTTSAKLAEINAQMKALEDKIGPNFDPDKIGENIAKLASDKADLEIKLAEARQVEETLNSRVTSLDESLASANNKVNEYKQNVTRPGVSGRVVAYNPGWNFVVLSIGDKAGLKSGTQMVLARDGRMIGKVRVTSVEPNTAIADVLPNTLARGAQIQTGDTVMFQGGR